MKLSLAWIFDHIAVDWRTIDIHDIVKRFNKTTAEIEAYYPISIEKSQVALAVVQSCNSESMDLFCSEWNTRITLALRNDLAVGDIALVYRKSEAYEWGTVQHVGGHKTNMMPALDCPESLLDGSWKKLLIEDDWIIEVDNKSINHRPDLWSHYGVAREIAAMFDLELKDIDALLAQECTQEFASSNQATVENISVMVENQGSCKRYSALTCSVTNRSSMLPVAIRLAKIDSKPINAIVDLTNYVMFDIGQPMHAFDASSLSGNCVTVRSAHNGETITLLDGQKVTLQSPALVIADAKDPIALAGVMGGQNSKVTLKTTQVFLESATFDPVTVRKTAMIAKIRTDASARFEKSLDPENAPRALKRFVALAHEYGLISKQDTRGTIMIIGQPVLPTVVTVSVEQIRDLLGVDVSLDFIEKTLHHLGFTLDRNENVLNVTIPSFRATKDVSIAQDIVEEVGRFYGYESIPTVLPKRYMSPFGIGSLQRIRHIKQLLAYGLGMQEVYNYALFDQDFINSIPYQPTHTLQVMSPVSENWQLLVTSLIPGLLKNVVDNAALHEKLSFFEWARTWNLTAGNVHEYKKLSGIIYRKQEKIDFYDAKQDLERLFESLDLSVSWKQCDYSSDPWFMPFQTAYLYHGNTQIGIAGKIQKQCLNKHVLGDAFLFEIDGNFLLEYSAKQPTFEPLPKYQPTYRDVSLFVSLQTTVDQVINAINKADAHITQVRLKDVFQKAEWGNRKSMTFEYVMSDPHGTLSKEAAEAIALKVERELKDLGGRSAMKLMRYLSLGLFLFFFDRLTKWYALNHLCGSSPINEYLCFRTAFNPGVSWGIFSEMGNQYWPILVMVIGTLLFVLSLYTIKNVRAGLASYGEVCVIAGGMSNLVDRFLYQGVVDFIMINYAGFEFPIFNFADVFIVIGVFLMLLSIRSEK